MAKAMITEPPSAKKLELIREFLRVSGYQADIDSGSFLDRLGSPGSELHRFFVELSPRTVTYGDFLSAPTEALRAAYQKHRALWQNEHETHVNWAFTEDDLAEIVTFLRRPAGQNFLEDRWRMRAYISSDTEDVVETIVAEAREILASRFAPDP